MNTTTFEVGKIYETRSICGYDAVYRFRILGRTAKTIATALMLLTSPAMAEDVSEINGMGAEVKLTDKQLAAAKAAIADQLRDPDSAKFIGVLGSHPKDSEDVMVCGFVNAKNAFGGYVGKTPFYVKLSSTDSMIEFRVGDDEMGASLVSIHCSLAGIKLAVPKASWER